MNRFTVKEWIVDFDNGLYNVADDDSMRDCGWTDWDCDIRKLPQKVKKWATIIKKISKSPKIDVNENYLEMRNRIPEFGYEWDEIRVCDVHKESLYTLMAVDRYVILKKGKDELTILCGTWTDVIEFFNSTTSPY